MSHVYSMTGFATVQGEPAGECMGFTLTVKSVNHRFLDLQVRLPHRFEALELAIRAKVKEHVRRGHVELSLQMEQRGGGGLRLNNESLAEYVSAYTEAAEAYGVMTEIDLNALLRAPGVMTPGTQSSAVGPEACSMSILDATERLLGHFNDSRAVEGGALATELRSNMEHLLLLADEVLQLRIQVRTARFERLRERMAALLDGIAVSEERLLTESAMLVERSDVEEEMVRLRTHVERFLAMIEEGGELGKRMDFLVQEMNREANTLLSKTNGVGEALRITEIGLAMKMEIERAKEQVQNLE